ncbi:MAG: SDR family NAD(P)-dependent oxidoreductase [Pseudomonadota bacterium]
MLPSDTLHRIEMVDLGRLDGFAGIGAALAAARPILAAPVEGADAALRAMDRAARLYALGHAGAAPRSGEVVEPWRRRLSQRVTALAAALDARADDAIAAADAILEEAERAVPAFAGEMALLRRAGAALGSVVSGERDGVSVLFDGGAVDDGALGALYKEAPFAARANAGLRAAVEALAGRDRAPIRVLEVGAGTGGTTAAVSAALPEGSDYLFTDISPGFLQRGAERFGVRTALYDLTADPYAQGLRPGAFDLVVASNAVHVAPDLGLALERLHGLLAPGGALLLAEAGRARPALDITFGLTPGWWAFQDARCAAHSPLLSPTDWIAALGAAGFVEAAELSGLPEPEQAILLALKCDRPVSTGLRSILAPESDVEAGMLSAALGAEIVRTAEEIGGDVRDVILPVRAAASPDEAVATALPAVHALMARQDAPRLWFLVDDDETDPGVGAIEGLARTLWRERAEMAGGVLKTDARDDVPRLARLFDRFMSGPGEDRATLREGRLLLPRIETLGNLARTRPGLDQAGTWLVIGGLGGLGPLVAERLAMRGARRIVLAGRSGTAEPERLRPIREAGADVRAVALDCRVEAEVAALLDRIRDGGALAGIVYAAGVLDDATLPTLTADRFGPVIAAKAGGAAILDRLTRQDGAIPFLFFSSAVGALGAPGQATHATANGAMTAVAAARRAAGFPSVVLHWGGWSEVGAAARHVAVAEGQGARAIPPSLGLDILDCALAGDLPDEVIVLPVDWRAWLDAQPTLAGQTLFATLARAAAPSDPNAPDPAASARPPAETLGDRLASAPASRHLALVTGAVRAAAAEILGHTDAGHVPVTRPLGELGLDSLMAMQLRDRLASMAALPLGPQIVYDHPSVAALSEHLLAMLSGSADVPATPADSPAKAGGARAGHDEKLADAALDLDALDALSDEEAGRLLAEMARSPGKIS